MNCACVTGGYCVKAQELSTVILQLGGKMIYECSCAEQDIFRNAWTGWNWHMHEVNEERKQRGWPPLLFSKAGIRGTIEYDGKE